MDVPSCPRFRPLVPEELIALGPAGPEVTFGVVPNMLPMLTLGAAGADPVLPPNWKENGLSAVVPNREGMACVVVVAMVASVNMEVVVVAALTKDTEVAVRVEELSVAPLGDKD